MVEMVLLDRLQADDGTGDETPGAGDVDITLDKGHHQQDEKNQHGNRHGDLLFEHGNDLLYLLFGIKPVYFKRKEMSSASKKYL